MSKVKNYFEGYKTKSNKDSELRWYSHGKSKRLYVSRKLIGQYVKAYSAGGGSSIIIELGDPNEYSLKVNNEHFISLSRLSDGDFSDISSKALVYGAKAKQLINNK